MKALVVAALLGLVACALGLATPDYQAVDGTNNGNASGAINVALVRVGNVTYEDGVSVPTGGLTMSRLPSARLVSNMVSGATGLNPPSTRLSDWFTFWGQFMDHDFDLVGENDAEPFDILVPANDPVFDPMGLGNVTLPLVRSVIVPGSGTNATNPREQPNTLTAYIDANTVYGHTVSRAAALRTNQGGLLRTSANGELLPLNINPTIPMGNINIVPLEQLYAGGDPRVNENTALMAVHNLWVREHNRLANAYAADPAGPCVAFGNSDECLYQEARRRVIGYIQAITLNEWGTLAFGPGAVPAYAGFNAAVNAGITNVFATGVFRMGHTLLNDNIPFGVGAGATMIPLNMAFFNPAFVDDGTDVEQLWVGMPTQANRAFDVNIVSAVRNTLFQDLQGMGGQDLVARNLQRARDHGLERYNEVRVAFGLAPRTSFNWCAIAADCTNIMTAYGGNLTDVEVFIGMVSEAVVNNGNLGETAQAVILSQYLDLRNGDEYWYENTASPTPFAAAEITEIRNTRLSDVILRTSPRIASIPCNVMELNGGSGGVCMNPLTPSTSGAAALVVSALAALLAALLLL